MSARSVPFFPIQKPQDAGQGDGVEEVRPDGVVEVFVVGAALFDCALQAMHGEVHARQPHGGIDALLAVDGKLAGGIFPVRADEAGALDEPAAGAAGEVEDAPVKGGGDFDEQADDAGGRGWRAEMASCRCRCAAG